MNRIELIRMLRGHIKLAEKRSAAYEQNRTAKVVMYVMSGFMIVYLIFLAILFAMIANDSASTTPYEFLYSLAPFILCVDFLFRFMAQQTPAQLIKPYILQPIPKHACVESFIVTAMIIQTISCGCSCLYHMQSCRWCLAWDSGLQLGSYADGCCLSL